MSLEKSAALSADPQGEAGAGTPASPVPSRCRASIHNLDTPEWHPRPEGAPRRRCIHPKGHHGPHFFGDAR